MVKMVKKNSIGGGVGIFVGFVFLYGSIKLGLYNESGPLAGLFPLIASIILIFLSTITFISSITREKEKIEGNQNFFPEKESIKRVLGVVFSLIFYQVVFEKLGYFLSTLIFTIFLLKVFEPKKWTTIFKISILITVLSYILFVYLLHVRFPKGIFGI